MSVFSGPQAKGAMRIHRALKRDEANARNALTPPERRRANRLTYVCIHGCTDMVSDASCLVHGIKAFLAGLR